MPFVINGAQSGPNFASASMRGGGGDVERAFLVGDVDVQLAENAHPDDQRVAADRSMHPGRRDLGLNMNFGICDGNTAEM